MAYWLEASTGADALTLEHLQAHATSLRRSISPISDEPMQAAYPLTAATYGDYIGGCSWTPPVAQDADSPTVDVLHSVLQSRKSWKKFRGGETVWPLELESALLEGLGAYEPDDSRETRMLGRFPRRNRFISDYIFEKTGQRRSAKQVGSRLQQLRESCGGQKSVLHLLSPFKRQYPRRRDSTSPFPSSPDGSYAPRHVVVCIDIVPQDDAGDTTRAVSPSSSCAYSDSGDCAIFHPSPGPRRLADIDPTITLKASVVVCAESRFTVQTEGSVIHVEAAPLQLVYRPGETTGEMTLYSTPFVPNYWDVITRSPDPTRFSIFHEVLRVEEHASKGPEVVLFSATYRFSYSTVASASDSSRNSSPQAQSRDHCDPGSLSERDSYTPDVHVPDEEDEDVKWHQVSALPLYDYASPALPIRRPGSSSTSTTSTTTRTSTCFPLELSNYVS
ncbi:unnamed protein product [Mycena citricolor]|uniref:TEA domain-containing protein n=1 Tax=Mycena citricolor TaxID=2018698 RepID=A0AAD2Q2X3_9AGAR|nr:unnamed protein product [Mycena citricolor]